MEDFEKLGTFYLGKAYDAATDKVTDELILYDSKDLTTHAVIIGMTGSGKTGLGICLLEEAAIDHIPVIAIDPKGDLGNILLTFPELRPEKFQPWVNAQEAANRGMSVAEYAKDQARLWAQGLDQWGQSQDRIARLRDAVDMAIYTPGSTSGLPISVLRSFNAPAPELQADTDLYRERIAATATSILALVDIEADPITSREHILVANVLQHTWDAGQNLDIAGLIASIQQPPLKRVGVMDIDAFFPPKERFELAMRLNNLLAAPGFDVWMEGTPLDAGRLLHTDTGKPRLSVVSIAHLSDAERMFFVTMLLNEILSWMRRQPGTGSLRAILYMDEIFGYLPPNANPPSKMLFLTLLKQARAFGLGLVLATQNPVDLDYKALSNAGTWFIGRLQTERDKARLMDGLEGAATGEGFDRQRMERVLAGLGKRRFLLHNVHENEPVVFGTRWVLSYLAGPFTRDQIKMLMADHTAAAGAEAAVAPKTPQAAASRGVRPMLPPEVAQYYLPATRRAEGGETLVYHPYLLGAATVAYSNSRYDVSDQRRVVALTEVVDGPVPVDWNESDTVDIDPGVLENAGIEGAEYVDTTSPANEAKNYKKWQKGFENWVRSSQTLTLFKSPTFKTMSRPAETEGEFRARLQVLANEQRDLLAGKLRKKYEAKTTTLEDRLRRAEQRISSEAAQSQHKKLETAIAFGTAILGAFLGRKRISATTADRMGTAVKTAGRMGKEAEDVRRAQENAEALRQQLRAVNEEFERELAQLEVSLDAQKETLETVEIKPKSADVHVQLLGVGWAPYYRSEDGRIRPSWV